MLRIPKHGMVALDIRHFFGRGTVAGSDEYGGDVFSFGDAIMRGILSAALIFVLLVFFLL
jgi:hypothetical protein